MSIAFLCPHCGHKLRAAEASAGQQATCKCGQPVTIPATSGSTTSESVGASDLPAYLLDNLREPNSLPSYLRDIQQGQADLPSYLLDAPATTQALVLAPPAAASTQVEPTPPPPPQPLDERPSLKPDRRRWVSRTVWLTVFVAIAGAILIFVRDPDRGGQGEGNNSDDPAGDALSGLPPRGPASPVRQALESGLKLTGTVTPGLHAEPVDEDNPWECLRWQIELSLVNHSSLPLDLGKDFFLFETKADLSARGDFSRLEGVALFRGFDRQVSEVVHLMPFPVTEPYGLANNFQIHFASGQAFLRRGTRYQKDDGQETLDNGKTFVPREGGPQFGSDTEDPTTGYGPLGPQQTRQFSLYLDQGVWLREEERDRVTVILPEIVVANQPRERYRLVAHFQKPPPNKGEWPVVRYDLVRQDAGELAGVLETSTANPVLRIGAANWLAETAPENCREPLLRVGRSLQEGRLLGTCLELLIERKATGLEEHALQLLQGQQAPPEIRGLAALYLGVLRHGPALSSLIRTAGDASDAAALGAIHGLGAYGPPAAGALLDLLGSAPPPRAPAVSENLVFTGAKTPALLAGVQQLADKDNQAAMHALIKSGYPENYAYFQSRAGTERRPEWKALVAWGLIKTGGDKALQAVLDMLRQDTPPPASDPLQTNELVYALRGWPSATLNLGLLDLARGSNLRAVQVLAGLPQEGAMVALTVIARTGTEPQVLIAIDGLAQHWSRQSIAVFREALPQANKTIVKRAIDGLGNAGDPAAAAWLTPYADHADADVRAATEQALKKLKPGKSES